MWPQNLDSNSWLSGPCVLEPYHVMVNPASLDKYFLIALWTFRPRSKIWLCIVWVTARLKFGLNSASEAPGISFGSFPCTCASGCSHFSLKKILHDLIFFCPRGCWFVCFSVVYCPAEGQAMHFLWHQPDPYWLRICIFSHVPCISFLVIAIFRRTFKLIPTHNKNHAFCK